jgi:hypothetical protein
MKSLTRVHTKERKKRSIKYDLKKSNRKLENKTK